MALEYDYDLFEPAADHPGSEHHLPGGSDHDLLASRLIAMGNLLRSSATQRFRHMFGLSLTEWLIVTQLAAEAPLPVNELATRTGLDQSRVSTVVTRLFTGGLVARAKNPENGRQVLLSLTPRGRSVFNAIIQNWLNKELVLGLAPNELATLNDLLDRLAIKARNLLEQESKGLQ
jgi:DNA-binding MarR family transcriptional regulator